LLELAGMPLEAVPRGLVLRGVIRLLGTAQLSAAQKADDLRRLAPLADDAAGRKLLLSALAQVHHVGALELIMPALDDRAVQTEAALAAIAVARGLGSNNTAVVNAAMKRLLDVVRDENLRRQARGQIRAAQPVPSGAHPAVDK